MSRAAPRQSKHSAHADDLRGVVREWATRMNVKAPNVHVRQMRTKWASISTAGRLTLNLDLLALPQDLVDFVIVHELVHLIAPNHGRLFKSFMYAYLPDWDKCEQRLRRYGEQTEL